MYSSSLPYLIIVMSGWPIEDRYIGETRGHCVGRGAFGSNATARYNCRYILFSASRMGMVISVGAPMAFLNFTCPETRQQAPTSIGMDAASLRAAWSKTINVVNLSQRELENSS